MQNIIPLMLCGVKMAGSTIHFVFSAKRHKCLTQGWALRYSGLWFTLSRVVADMSDDPGCILSAFWSVILEASNHCARGWIHFYTRPNILHLLYAPCILTLMPKSCGHVFGVLLGAMKSKCAQDLKELPEDEKFWSCGTFCPKCTNSNLSRYPRPPMCLPRSKSVESCRPDQREAAFKEFDDGLELHSKPHRPRELNCVSCI